MLEPLGQSQVLSYLNHLSLSTRIHLISFEKREDLSNIEERLRVREAILAAGIVWYPLQYHRLPTGLATFWDILCGTLLGLWLTHRYCIEIIHVRSYVPAVIALVLQWVFKIKFLFDMRGFWADEKVDGGLWQRNGIFYKVTKRFERRFLLSADHVVSLTNAAVAEIQKFPYLRGRTPPISVIPTCADLSRFAPKSYKKSSCSGDFVLGYVGSIGTYYMFEHVISCFIQLRHVRPSARLLIVNRGQHHEIRDILTLADVPEESVELTSSTHNSIPQMIARMDAGIFFIKPVFSKRASAPTKLAEFLGCGIPCLSNTGVGDLTEVLEGENVGVALRSFDTDSVRAGLAELLALVDNPEISERCTAVAQRYFSLSSGVEKYQRIYDLLSD